MASGTLFAAFCSGSNAERSPIMDAEQTINLFRSSVEMPGAPKSAFLLGTPGLKPLGSVGALGTGRGVFTQDERTWTVIGENLYEVISLDPFEVVSRGTVGNDQRPCSFASNGDAGQQLAVTSAGDLYILGLLTNTLTGPISVPLTNRAVSVAYLDGYFLLMEYESLRLWFSAIADGTSWDALDFIARSTASDYFVNMVVANNRVWGFGSETSEAFEDVGEPDTPFVPIRGSLFQIGLAACWSLSVGINTMRWVGRSSRGGAMVFRLDGYGGQRISTHALEATLGAAPTIRDAEAVTYDQDGHLFYALTFPQIGDVRGATYVFDETEQQWHQRSSWNQADAIDEAWRVRGHAYVGTTHVVGSRDSDELWALDLETYDDAGAIQRAVRRAPYLGAGNIFVFLDQIELGMQAGVGLNSGQGSDPQVLLNVSKDGGQTWMSAGAASLGKMGQYLTSAVWRKLGRVRLDRLVLEVVITDPIKRSLGPGLWITATPGRP